MSEVTFAKTFLATCDKRPIKLPADHVSDPRKYPNQSPYILPKNPHPFPGRNKPTSTAQAQETTITATLKPMRAGETVTLQSTTLDTTIHDLKTQYADKTGVPQDKIKLLLNKKPAADLKTLKDLGVNGEKNDVELSVMIMGGTGTTPSVQSPAVEKADPTVASPPPSAPPPDAAGDKMDVDPAPLSEKAELDAEKAAPQAGSAQEILKTEEFWTDLQGFLAQRLRSQDEGEALAKTFREAWSKGSS